MNEFETFWTNADTSQSPTAKPQREAVPTGTYNTWIEKAQLDLTKPPGKVSIWYKIEEGEHTGRILFANYSLNQVGTQMLKKEMLKLGAPQSMKSLNDLGEFLNSIYGRKCEVYAKHRTFTKADGTTGDAHNVYVNSALAVDAAFADAPAKPGVDTDEKLPF